MRVDLVWSTLLALVIGHVVGQLVVAPYSGPLFLPLLIGGGMISLPLLLVGLIAVLLAPRAILRRRGLFALAVPAVSVAYWLAIEAASFGARSSGDQFWSAMLGRWTGERAALALLCASISSYVFWKRAKPIAAGAGL